MIKVAQDGISEAQVKLPVRLGHLSVEKGEGSDRACWATYMGHRTSSVGACLPSSEAFSIPRE